MDIKQLPNIANWYISNERIEAERKKEAGTRRPSSNREGNIKRFRRTIMYEDKVPPYDFNAERAALGAMLMENELISKVV